MNSAILVVHGIGEQNPYETLDAFARGFARHFARAQRGVTLRAERIRHDEWTEVAVHLDLAPTPQRGPERLSVFEFYWAPYTEGKVSIWGVLWWLARTALTPLRYLGDNLQMLLWAQGQSQSRWAVTKLFLRELLRIAFGYLPALILSGVVYLLLYVGLPGATDSLSQVWSGLRSEPNPIGLLASLVCLGTALTLLWFILRDVFGRLFRMTPGIEAVAEGIWLGLACVCFILFSIATVLVAQMSGVHLGQYFPWRLMSLVLLALLVWRLKHLAVTYLGDIAVYVTADERAASYEARTAILEHSRAALSRLLVDTARAFDQVIIAGHSLGSVIAYDTLNELLSAVWATPDPMGGAPGPTVTRSHLEKLKGLVTFGSPLDKVYYFYREHVGAEQAVRAQILSFLHSFRRARSGRDYGSLTFEYPDPPPIGQPPHDEPFAFPQLSAGFQWINFWARLDPVSGPLRFYRLQDTDRYRLPYRLWGLAHLAYWRDPHFYDFIASRFGL